MTVIPAIDVMSGRCVRLRQGVYDDATVYGVDPVEIALRFVDTGANRIHLVDLDAARGDGDNRDTIARIRHAVSCTLEVGGGIRGEDRLQEMLDLGMDYVVVGTVLARDPDQVARWAAAEERGAHMLASIDARDGEVLVQGWQEGSSLPAATVAGWASSMGFAAIQYTNIARDGMLSGPDTEGTVALAQEAEIPVILSGGIASTEDTSRILKEAPQLAGFIVGRALYEGTFDLAHALALVSAHEERAS